MSVALSTAIDTVTVNDTEPRGLSAAATVRPRAPGPLDVADMLDAADEVGHEQPCRTHDPELWFADAPEDLERAKQLCRGCPVRSACLTAALVRGEYSGVWGGEIFHRGRVLPQKRRRGRPRKEAC